MKAILLAAGTGTRLRPITDVTPKCLLKVNGECLLDLWLDSFQHAGVDEVLINLHHLAAAVQEHVRQREGPPSIHLSLEPILLGSAGTLLVNRDWIGQEELILVCNADNLTDFDLNDLVHAHRAASAPATVAVFHSPHPQSCGVVEVDAQGKMVGFCEKPEFPVSNLANAGMYAFDPRVLDGLNGELPLDIGYDLLPALVGRAQVVKIDGYFLDIGTPDALARAQHEWKAKAAR